MKNYSSTLNLPKTLFSPKVPSGDKLHNFLTTTTSLLYDWQLKQPVNAYLGANPNPNPNPNSNPQKQLTSRFILHDGPPYANGDLHLGHALNKVLKDIINRYHLLYKDQQIHYTPGWDCHGLPIELKVTRPGQDPVSIRQKSRELANSMIDKQQLQFEQFGIMSNWQKYKTMDHSFEINQLKIFKKVIDNQLLIRQLKPVWYGVDTKTALAEAELEYKDHVSLAIHAKFKLENDPSTSVLIWTSTPWTLKANQAICVNKNLEYVKITNGHENLIIGKFAADDILKLDSSFYILEPVDTTELLKCRYINPLTNQICPILHGDHVIESGTGLVHTAPAHGAEDYFIGLSNNLKIESVVNDEGELDFVEGKVNQVATIKKCIDIYKQLNMVYHVAKYNHSYPYDWRLKTPVIQRATPQWFINVDKIKSITLAALENVQFLPETGKTRLSSFIKGRNEWCISRQRSWGVPIPIIYYKGTPQIEWVDFIINKMDKLGTNAWFDTSVPLTEWIPEEFTGSIQDIHKGIDTMDVWFDSGTSWTILDDIADVYLEGSDQHRGWFQSSILNKIISTGDNGKFQESSCFKKVITHGFVLDKNNTKMSKSQGNIIAPSDLVNGTGKLSLVGKLGIDGLRLWIAGSNYTGDVNISNEILSRVQENLKKFRVTFKFLLGNLGDNFTNIPPMDTINEFDRYILDKLYHLQKASEHNYQDYNFQKVIRDINNNMTLMSSLYFDANKDCLYTDSVDNMRRQGIQYVLQETLKVYIGILSPILPILTQEVWGFTPWKEIADAPFQMPYSWYTLTPMPHNFDSIPELRDIIFTKFESLRKQGLFKKNLELIVGVGNKALLIVDKEVLSDILLVSNVYDIQTDMEWIDEVDTNLGPVKIGLSKLHKCPRCWKHNSDDGLCQRCHLVVSCT